MFREYKKIVIYILLFWMIIPSVSFISMNLFIQPRNGLQRNDEINKKSLKTSNGGIVLNTPENKTYTEPMNDYFLGTYGFESDDNGAIPEGWDDGSTANSYVKVIPEKDNHKKVMQLFDYSRTEYAFAENMWSTWGPQSHGTIEFWYMTENVADLNQITLSYGETTRFRLRIKNGKWSYSPSLTPIPGFPDNLEVSADTWYHIKIDFETTTGDYHDLGQYRCRLTINDKYVSGQIPFDTNGQLSRLWFISSEADAAPDGYSIYVDSVGYSFDSEYEIGDNLKEGLNLNFESSYHLDSISYSLDGQTNKTILGNSTIKMPSNDQHTIQIFGLSETTIFSSAKKYFTVNIPFDILTPENKTYSKPMTGYYPSTYGFEDEEVGEYGTNIDFVDYYNDANGLELYVNGYVDGHQNVLDIYDHSAATGILFYHFFDSARQNGTVEFWWRVTDVTPGVGFALCQDTTFGPRIDIVNDYIRYFDSSPHNIMHLSDNEWYRIVIDFECGSGAYKGLPADHFNITIAGAEFGPYPFDNALSNINRIRIWTGDPATGIHDYIDAIGFSWDDNYEIGDNFFNGFLMQYQKNIETNLIKCSFDGGTNKTINDDYLLPRVEQGRHTVQVFAQDIHGITHQTELRQFAYYDGAHIPASPSNFRAMDGLNHTYLTWDSPSETNAPILKFNIYRGDQISKSLLNSTTDTFYNDTDSKNYLNQRFYYYVTTVNIVGESDPSDEDYATARNSPSVEWKFPEENERVIFPPGNVDTFTFEYTSVSLDDVRLFLNSIDYGSVYNNSFVEFEYCDELEGVVNATLIGYQYGIPITFHTRYFKFAKVEFEVEEMLDSGTEFIGQVLYLILHDPVGDHSFSGFEKSTSLCTKITDSFTAQENIGLQIDTQLFTKTTFSADLEWKQSSKNSVTYRIADVSSLTSSLVSSDKDFIGPGLGDIYWGEAEVLNYEFKAFYREYWNGTKIYEDPNLYWGILRDSEVFLSDKSAPEEWRMQNPVHNGWQNVDWDWVESGYQTYEGGTKHMFTHENVTTTARSTTVSFSVKAGVKIRFLKNKAGLDLSLKFTWENFEENIDETKYKVSYTVYDDEPNDLLCQRVGLDKKFGTIVFKPNPTISKTSYPLEYNSSDYIAPIIDFPTIDFDSNNDGLGPCSDDRPEVVVGISDEGGVSLALATYSTDNWLSDHEVILEEQLGNPGFWSGSLPLKNHGTKVEWYIRVWDYEGYYASRYDAYNNSFSYSVLNRDPRVQLLSPLGGESFQNSVVISWSGSDPENDDLNYTIAYNNGGIGWHLIARELTDTSYTWDISNLPYSESILVKVIAKDGFGGTNEDISEFLFTIGEPPAGGGLILNENLTYMFIGTGINAAMIGIAVIFLRKFRSN